MLPRTLRTHARSSRTAGVLGLTAALLLGGGLVPAAVAASPTKSLTLYAAPSGQGSGSGSGSGPGTTCEKASAPCSLTAAQAAVRKEVAEPHPADITVVLADGTYRLAHGLDFGPADSGKPGHPVTWRAAPGAHPVISGGTQVTRWTHAKGSDVWSAPVPAGTRTRQLYVDGVEAPVAQKTPAQLGLSLTSWDRTAFTTTGSTATWFSDLAARLDATQLKELQFVYTPAPPMDWATVECPVASVSAGATSGTTTVGMAQPCWNNVTNKQTTVWGGNSSNITPYSLAAKTPPTMIENAYALLSPGQWYLDNSADRLYFQPASGQRMSDLDVEIPRLESLVNVAGSLAHPVHDLTFRGITFSTATWNQPSTPTGFAQVQDNLMVTQPLARDAGGDVLPASQGECHFAAPAEGSCPWAAFDQPLANVQLTAARHVTFDGDRFSDLGGIGLGVRYGSDDNLVRGSEFSQIASSAIWLGCSGDPTPGSTDDPAATVIADCSGNPSASAHDAIGDHGVNEIMTGNVVDDNVIHDAGLDYIGAAGVTMLFTRHTTISHNDIFDMPYDGITSGAWQGHPDAESLPSANPPETLDQYWNHTTNINAHNAITANWFHQNMQMFGDGGDVYTEGQQGPTVYRADGSIDQPASYAQGLTISGNVGDTDTGHSSYFIAPDVGSQWITVTGNVEWNSHYSMSSHWPTNSACRNATVGNWQADPDDSPDAVCIGANTAFPSRPGPADLASTISGRSARAVLGAAGPQGAYQAVDAGLPARITYSGTSPATAGTPEQVLVAGSGFSPSKAVYIGGVRVSGTDLTVLSSGFIIANVPAGADPTDISIGRPPAPVITDPAPFAALPNSPTRIGGTGLAGATVTVTDPDAGRQVCTATVAPNGTWACAPATAFGNGVRTISAVQADRTGTSAPRTVSVIIGPRTLSLTAKVGFGGSFTNHAYAPGADEVALGTIDRRAGTETVQPGQGVVLKGGDNAVGFAPATSWGDARLIQNFVADVKFTPVAGTEQPSLATLFAVGGNLWVRYGGGRLTYGFAPAGESNHTATAPLPATGQQHDLRIGWDSFGTVATLHIALDGVELPAVTGDAPPSTQVLDDTVGIGNDVHPAAQSRGFIGTIAGFRIGTYDGPFDPTLLTELGG
ncbi:Ig-like domain-containing protein [Streptomyces sp. NBC_00448]|uniref:Ig-like domain-containing protein n=1 Tax=Streptomyces sp. NBC_00448 TaxID=2903652 RepID=UPI002E1A56D0